MVVLVSRFTGRGMKFAFGLNKAVEVLPHAWARYDYRDNIRFKSEDMHIWSRMDSASDM